MHAWQAQGNLCETSLSCCRLAINRSVRQLTGDGGEIGAEPMSILPTAQWTRAADLLTHTVETTEKESPSAYTCMECQVGAVSFLAHSQIVCLPSSAYDSCIGSFTRLAGTSPGLRQCHCDDPLL